MWKMIIGQAIYQLAITLTLYFAGGRILGYNLHDPQKELELNTIIFNTFVWMQIFNEFNNRRLDNRLNIFEGMWKNYWFLGINCIMIGGQLMIIFVGSVAFSVTPLDVVQWAICIACAICCLPWAIVLRQIPDEHFEVVFNFFVHTAAFIFRPLMRVLIRVTKPIGKSIKAACTATKRFGIRAILKKRNGSGPAQDEEVGSWTDSKQKLPSQQIELPPITITTTN
jgi:P-type Ca2+ transporter type 2C